MTQFVVTAIGPDRPGLVDELSQILLDAGANIADSRMANLRGRFAIIMLVEASDQDDLDAIAATITEKGRAINLTIVVDAHSQPEPREAGMPYHVKVYAMDRPGIVHHVSHLLSRQDVNIEDLTTHLEPAAYNTTPVFSLEMIVSIPPHLSLSKLRKQLEELCESLNCDIELEPAS